MDKANLAAWVKLICTLKTALTAAHIAKNC